MPYGISADVLAESAARACDVLAEMNRPMLRRGYKRLEDQIQKATLSTLVSDLVINTLADGVPELVRNTEHNGRPDLLPAGRYANDAAQTAPDGIEVKVSARERLVFDAHAARTGWYLLAKLRVDTDEALTPAQRQPTVIDGIYLAYLLKNKDFNLHERGAAGTDTATVNASACAKLRQGMIFQREGADLGAGPRLGAALLG